MMPEITDDDFSEMYEGVRLTIVDELITERELYRIAFEYYDTLGGLDSTVTFWKLFDKHKVEIKRHEDPAEFMKRIISMHKMKMDEMNRKAYPRFYYLKDLIKRVRFLKT